jgi:excisionase family DNA binding protein
MSIHEILSDGSNNISITVGISDLKEFGLSLIEEGRAMGRAERVQETYLTPDEVAKMLGVSKSTLWRWNKNGYLKHTKCGRRPFYKKSDIDKIMGCHVNFNKNFTNERRS